jgi:hypothetical protein
MEIQIHFSIPRLSPRSTPHRLRNFQSSLPEEFLAAEIRTLYKGTEKFTERPTKIQTKMKMKSMDRVALGAQQTKKRSARRTKRRIRRRLRMHLLLTTISSITTVSRGRLKFPPARLLLLPRMNLNKILLH